MTEQQQIIAAMQKAGYGGIARTNETHIALVTAIWHMAQAAALREAAEKFDAELEPGGTWLRRMADEKEQA